MISLSAFSSLWPSFLSCSLSAAIHFSNGRPLKICRKRASLSSPLEKFDGPNRETAQRLLFHCRFCANGSWAWRRTTVRWSTTTGDTLSMCARPCSPSSRPARWIASWTISRCVEMLALSALTFPSCEKEKERTKERKRNFKKRNTLQNCEMQSGTWGPDCRNGLLASSQRFPFHKLGL